MSKRSLFLVSDRGLPAEGAPILSTNLNLSDLFRHHSGYVAALGTRLLGRSNEVDDLVQDVFVRAMRGLGGLRDPGAVRGWLAAITVRQAYSRLARRQIRKTLGLDAPQDYEWLPDEGLSDADRATLMDLYRALDGLPAALRVPWVLRFGQGEQIDTIADLCRCSRATVKRRIEQAQQILERELADE